MSTGKRRYELRARAEGQAETRRRIAAATAELHQEVGPARTTIAEIARRAGVQRLTVYKHFPDEVDLHAACQGHFLARNPPPDLAPLLALEDPGTRVEAVLRELYGWYRRGGRTSVNVRRDRELVPALDALLAETADARAAELAEALSAGLGARGRRRTLRAATALAVDFWTWHRLSREGLDESEAARLMAGAVLAATTGPAPRARARASAGRPRS